MLVNLPLASSKFNMSAVSISFTGSASNNQALNVYSEGSYSLGTAVEYISTAIAALALILLILGYFGCKLQTI